MVRVFIQARMSSARLPGKVLAPFHGQPLIRQVIDRVAEAVPRSQIVLVTSADPTDDPLACYVESLGVAVFRGPLANVLERFQRCAAAYPADWVIRISGDSPLMSSAVIRRVIAAAQTAEADVVTNVFPRTFPRGCSVEAINARSLAALDSTALTAEEQEHVTGVFYNHPDRYRIINVDSGRPELAAVDLTVDTLDDLRRLEAFDEAALGWEGLG